MGFFQILDCSTLGTCCTDYGVVGILSVTKMVFDLIQLVVPIILIVAGTIQFVQLTINPELKDGFRRVLNKFMAAVIVFLLPALVDLILTATSSNFSVAACWKEARGIAIATPTGGGVFMPSKYIQTDEDGNKNSAWLDPNTYYTKTTKKGSTSTTATRQNIVNYALQFVGEEYKYGGRWSGNLPYVPTDCIGFVKGIYSHFGFTKMKNAPNGTQSFYKYINSHPGVVTKISESELKPADIVLWKGHIALYIGNGQIVHAAGKKKGVKVGKLYKGDTFRGFYRVNGVE